jgi:hypothetical protein
MRVCSLMVPMGRRKLSIFLAPLLLAPLGLSLWWLWTRQEHTASRFDEVLDLALAPVMEQRDVQLKLGAATPTQARLLARELALRSVPYLAARDLELWAATRQRVAVSSKATCARLWKGGDDLVLGNAIAALGDEPLDAYTAMLSRGLALRLERKPPPQVAPGSVERGVLAVASSLPADARAAFEADVKRPDVSDERACQLFLTLSRGAEALEPALRVDFYRALASELKQPP